MSTEERLQKLEEKFDWLIDRIKYYGIITQIKDDLKQWEEKKK